MLLGVAQDSLLGLFSYICNFADDNLLYSIEDSFKEVKTISKKKNFELVQG